jgi:predicted transcriptional regulator
MPISIDDLTTRIEISKERILQILNENKDLAYTQKELAELTGQNQSTISRNLEKLMKHQKIWKRFLVQKRGRPTAYFCIRNE